MTCSQLLFLKYGGAQLWQNFSYLFSLVSQNSQHRLCLKLLRQLQTPKTQGLTSKLIEHLRTCTFHSGTLTRTQHHRRQIFHHMTNPLSIKRTLGWPLLYAATNKRAGSFKSPTKD